MQSPIAEIVGVGGEQELVDHDSVVAFEAALPRQRVFRDDADPDHDHVGAQRLAVGEDDRFRAPATLDRGDADAKPEARAEGARAPSRKNPT